VSPLMCIAGNHVFAFPSPGRIGRGHLSVGVMGARTWRKINAPKFFRDESRKRRQSVGFFLFDIEQAI
jgi:hypothetical protein